MRRKVKRTTNQIKKYTAFVPRSLRATRNVGKYTIKKINYFLRNTAKKVKNTTKMLNRTAAKSIRSITKRRSRR
jgi:hypothetical protein